MFRKDGKLAAVIDWGFCASDYPLIYDLAIVANDWCLKDGGHVLDDVRLSVLMSARKEISPLTSTEEKSWGMALRLAALRFYLSRQHDASFPRDEDGKSRKLPQKKAWIRRHSQTSIRRPSAIC